MKKKQQLYPGIAEAEKEKTKTFDFIKISDDPIIVYTANGYCPNYDKLKGMTIGETLIFCNMD